MLEARSITFRYGPREPLIYDGFSFSVRPGERIHLDAPSGFGKTTLCRLLSGYLRPLSGAVLMDGASLPSRGACPVQLIGQHPERVLDPRMRMQASLAEAGEVDAGLLARLGIRDEWLTRFPHELSGGEMQRFCIARALLARPRYLICDEISTMLDAVTQARIWNVVLCQAQEQQLGLVVVSHSAPLLQRLGAQVVDLGQLAEGR